MLDLKFTVIDSFPEASTCLRYVVVGVAEDSSLSYSASLWNDETLIIKGLGGRVTLLDTLWKEGQAATSTHIQTCYIHFARSSRVSREPAPQKWM